MMGLYSTTSIRRPLCVTPIPGATDPGCRSQPALHPHSSPLPGHRGGFDKKPATSLGLPGASGRVTHAA